jgi:hypothetical protein
MLTPANAPVEKTGNRVATIATEDLLKTTAGDGWGDGHTDWERKQIIESLVLRKKAGILF